MDVISWLLENPDPALALQVRRDLLGEPESALGSLKNKIAHAGRCRILLDARKPDGHWGNGFYNSKWACTHYALYELCQLGLPGVSEACRQSAFLIPACPRGADGGINYAKTVAVSDVCINGMILTIFSHFGIPGEKANEIADYLLDMRMDDGGWNCEYYHGARHSSLHTTIAVLEGLKEFGRVCPSYRPEALAEACGSGMEFILRHRLFRTSTTGEVIKDEFFKFCFPVRWKYDILRCLDLFRKFGVDKDPRMDDAIEVLWASRDAGGRWKSQSQPGKTFYTPEKNGAPGRWNTLRALRVLKRYGEVRQ